jgi:hypothetical protein
MWAGKVKPRRIGLWTADLRDGEKRLSKARRRSQDRSRRADGNSGGASTKNATERL